MSRFPEIPKVTSLSKKTMGKKGNNTVEINESNVTLNKKEQKKYDKLKSQMAYHEARVNPLGKPHCPEEQEKVPVNSYSRKRTSLIDDLSRKTGRQD